MLVEVLDQHPELSPAVAETVLADHLSAERAEHANQRVADDRGPEVPDVHLLGDVRRRVIDHGADPVLRGVPMPNLAFPAGQIPPQTNASGIVR